MIRVLLSWACICSFLGLLGCNGPQSASVSGTVKLGGNPLPEGEIYFVEDGKAPDILEIKNGAFSGMVTVGKKKVQISSYKEGPKVPANTPGAGEAQKINIIPAKYNAKSTINEEIKAGGPNEFNYDLKNK